MQKVRPKGTPATPAKEAARRRGAPKPVPSPSPRAKETGDRPSETLGHPMAG